jgi:hypothetical protein
MYVNLFASPFHTRTPSWFTKVQTEHMHLASVETGEHIVVVDRAAGVCIKLGEDALLVVRMVASWRGTIVRFESACMHMLH